MQKIIDIENWISVITGKLKEKFAERLLFVGLQGSYNRGEATPQSDIDLIVILDKVSFEDLKTYRKIIDEMPDNDKACGFISGKEEIQKWSKSDLFQFFYDTKSIIGKLDDIIASPSIEDIKTSIKTNCENIYHMASHSFLHSNNYADDLQSLYKMTFFVLQAKYFISTGKYIPTKKELEPFLDDKDKEILKTCINKDLIPSLNTNELENLYKKLITWSRKNI